MKLRAADHNSLINRQEIRLFDRHSFSNYVIEFLGAAEELGKKMTRQIVSKLIRLFFFGQNQFPLLILKIKINVVEAYSFSFLSNC